MKSEPPAQNAPAACPQCGSPLAPDSPEGLCPACLLARVSIPTESGTVRSPEPVTKEETPLPKGEYRGGGDVSDEDSLPEEAPTSSRKPLLQSILFFMVRERWILGSSVGLLLAAGMAYWMMSQPPVFESQAEILIDFNEQKILSIEALEADRSTRTPLEQVMQVHVKSLKSPAFRKFVEARLANREEVTGDDAPRDLLKGYADFEAFKMAYVDGLIHQHLRGGNATPEVLAKLPGPDEMFREHFYRQEEGALDVGSKKRSQLIDVSFRHPDPMVARQVVHALIGSYDSFLGGKEKASNANASQFLRNEVEALRGQIVEQERIMQRYRQKHQIVETEEGAQSRASAKIDTLSGKVTTSNLELRDMELQLAAIEKVDPGDVVHLSRLPVISGFGLVSTVWENLELNREEQSQLELRYLERHPKILENKTKRSTLLRQLRDNVALAVDDFRARVRAKRQVQRELEAQLADAEDASLNDNDPMVDYRVMVGNLEILKSNYKDMRDRLNETEIAGRLDRTNVDIMTPATLPQFPVEPNPKKAIALSALLLLGGLFGLPLGLGFLGTGLKSFSDSAASLGSEPQGRSEKETASASAETHPLADIEEQTASTGAETHPPPDIEEQTASASAETHPLPDIDAVAKAFPQLEIDSFIGRGGMGAVYKARQSHLGRWVALKVLPASLSSDPAFAERFSREARVLAKLNHPNIVTLHDFGQSGDYFYLLMEFVDGVNLRQAMRAGRFTPEQALEIVPKICEALQFAHSEGILHRDIKPDNILLDGRGRVKIADFGIAKVIGKSDVASPSQTHDPASGEVEDLTKANTTLGTPHYMAPEQRMHPTQVDHRADIYSLGVVFYEMLTGELPVGKFAPPSQKSQVDARVDEIVLRALKTERAQRQQSAREVRTQVETVASQPRQSTPPPAPSPPASSKQPGSKISPGWAAFLAIAGLVLPLVVFAGARQVSGANSAEDARWRAQQAMIEDTEQALAGIEREIAQGGATPNHLAERQRLEAEIAQQQMDAEASLDRVTHHPATLISLLALALVALGPVLLLLGTHRGWRHLGCLRRGEVTGGRGTAMFAALFLPLLLLFGALLTLIYLMVGQGHWQDPPGARAIGLYLGLAAGALVCFGAIRQTWNWSQNLPKSKSRISGRLLVMGILILGFISLWTLRRQPEANSLVLKTPASATVGNDEDTTFCVYRGNEADFLLHYPGEFNTSVRSTSNHRTGQWEDQGTLTLPNDRTVGFLRRALYPDKLRLNGREFDLRQGRVFTIDETAQIHQLDIRPMVVRNQGELATFAAELRARHPIEPGIPLLKMQR